MGVAGSAGPAGEQAAAVPRRALTSEGIERRPGRPWVSVLVLGLVGLAAVGLTLRYDLPEVATLQVWVGRAGPWGWLAALAALTAALAIPTPRSALSLLAGAVFGFPLGLALVINGGLLGGLVGFGLTRWMGRDVVMRFAGARLARVDQFVSDRGALAVLTARLLPAPPFAVVSYAAGLSGVRTGSYCLGTALGVLPGSVFYVGIGASVTGIDSVVAWFTKPWHLVGVVATVMALATAWWLLRRRARTRSD